MVLSAIQESDKIEIIVRRGHRSLDPCITAVVLRTGEECWEIRGLQGNKAIIRAESAWMALCLLLKTHIDTSKHSYTEKVRIILY